MEAVLLSKRKPYMEKIFCIREKNEFYEEKMVSAPSKKSPTLRLSSLRTLWQDYVQKLTRERIKNIFHIDGDLDGNCFYVNDLRNLQNSKMYCFWGVFVPTTEYLLRLSDKTCAITFTMLDILVSSVSPLKRKCKFKLHINKTHFKIVWII